MFDARGYQRHKRPAAGGILSCATHYSQDTGNVPRLAQNVNTRPVPFMWLRVLDVAGRRDIRDWRSVHQPVTRMRHGAGSNRCAKPMGTRHRSFALPWNSWSNTIRRLLHGANHPAWPGRDKVSSTSYNTHSSLYISRLNDCKKENVVPNIAILYCKRIKDHSCVACAKCFKGIKNKNGEFARHDEIDLVAMTDCGDCPGLTVPRVKLLSDVTKGMNRPIEVLQYARDVVSEYTRKRASL